MDGSEAPVALGGRMFARVRTTPSRLSSVARGLVAMGLLGGAPGEVSMSGMAARGLVKIPAAKPRLPATRNMAGEVICERSSCPIVETRAATRRRWSMTSVSA